MLASFTVDKFTGGVEGIPCGASMASYARRNLPFFRCSLAACATWLTAPQITAGPPLQRHSSSTVSPADVLPLLRTLPSSCTEQFGALLRVESQHTTAACLLQGLPGKAPTLYRRMGAAGEPAVHLLSRLLSFEPRHRASAGEALSHEYFFEADPGRAGGRQPARPGASLSQKFEILGSTHCQATLQGQCLCQGCNSTFPLQCRSHASVGCVK